MLLLVVMPVFNEQAAVESVIREWFEVLDRCVGDFTFLAIDDGSTDETPAILKSLKALLGPGLEVIRRPNRGHGQSCLQGYRIALERQVPFILQIDSDGQSDPAHFPAFWDQRDQFDVIYGKRNRQDGIRRVLASKVLGGMLWIFARVNCADANVPYRLMNANACGPSIQTIPDDFDLVNIALAVQLRRNSMIRHGTVNIKFPPRRGGEPSVPFSKFAGKAIGLFRQLRLLEKQA